MDIDPSLVYSVIFVSVLVYALMKYFLGADGLGNALIATVIGFVVMPTMFGQGIASFLVAAAIMGLAVQQIYKTSYADSIVVTLIVMVFGVYLFPVFG